MTYAEKEGKAPFDWNAFLAKPIDEYKASELYEAKNLAGDWVTCACGNQCDIIPRHSGKDGYTSGVPIDKELQSLGQEFYEKISAIYYATYNLTAKVIQVQAVVTLHKIEKRSSELIAEILNQNKMEPTKEGTTFEGGDVPSPSEAQVPQDNSSANGDSIPQQPVGAPNQEPAPMEPKAAPENTEEPGSNHY